MLLSTSMQGACSLANGDRGLLRSLIPRQVCSRSGEHACAKHGDKEFTVKE